MRETDMASPQPAPGDVGRTARTVPPFRADHVGSLLRPESLRHARERFRAGHSEFVDLDQLCLSGQCGFSSTDAGNRLTIDEQRAKLELIVEVADDVWGA